MREDSLKEFTSIYLEVKDKEVKHKNDARTNSELNLRAEIVY